MTYNSNITIGKNDKKGCFYLSKCDLINKYNIKTAYKIPKIDSIVLEFPFDELIKACASSEKEQTNSTFQLKGATLFYVFTNLLPYINYNKSKISLKKENNQEIGYSLKIIIKSKEAISSFLYTLFVENWSKLVVEDFTLFKKIDSKDLVVKSKLQKKIVIRTSLIGNSFFEIESFLNQYLPKINPKNLSLKSNFIVLNSIKALDSTKLVKNLSPFWVNN
jgi:hypothetical protein